MPVPEFVLRLRHKLGHDPLWLPGVTAVVLDGERVLLVRRADNGAWGPVTGIVDPGEHPHRAARREVQEETGVSCTVEALSWVNVTALTVHPNDDQAQYLDHTFRCRYVSGDAHVADDESSEVGWFGLDELPVMAPMLEARILTAAYRRGPTRLGQPDETHPDVLRARVRIEAELDRYAARLDLPGDQVVRVDTSGDGGEPFIRIDGPDSYRWTVMERGDVVTERATSCVDDLLFWSFEAYTFTAASSWEASRRDPDDDFRRGLWARQHKLLASLEAAWAQRWRRELVAEVPDAAHLLP